jgi:hypothetical protein
VPYLGFVLLDIGTCLFFIGLVIANRAVLRMANDLNARYQRRVYRWYSALGAGSSGVIREYGVGPEKQHLRRGYAFIAAGIALMLLPALIHKATA